MQRSRPIEDSDSLRIYGLVQVSMTIHNASLDDQWLLLMRRMCHPTIARAENNPAVRRVWYVALCYNAVDLGWVLPQGNPTGQMQFLTAG